MPAVPLISHYSMWTFNSMYFVTCQYIYSYRIGNIFNQEVRLPKFIILPHILFQFKDNTDMVQDQSNKTLKKL